MPAAPAEAAPQGTEHVVEETIRDLKLIPGFQSYLILNNDGIVIKYENMSYRTAVHYSHQVLGLASKATKYIRDLFDAPDNEVESIRIPLYHRRPSRHIVDMFGVCSICFEGICIKK